MPAKSIHERMSIFETNASGSVAASSMSQKTQRDRTASKMRHSVISTAASQVLSGSAGARRGSAKATALSVCCSTFGSRNAAPGRNQEDLLNPQQQQGVIAGVSGALPRSLCADDEVATVSRHRGSKKKEVENGSAKRFLESDRIPRQFSIGEILRKLEVRNQKAQQEKTLYQRISQRVTLTTDQNSTPTAAAACGAMSARVSASVSVIHTNPRASAEQQSVPSGKLKETDTKYVSRHAAGAKLADSIKKNESLKVRTQAVSDASQKSFNDQRMGPPNFIKEKPENLVFQGGGAKGLAYVGILEAMEEKKMMDSVKRVAGASAGAIAAALLATGHSVKEMKNLLENMDTDSFLDYQDTMARDLMQVAIAATLPKACNKLEIALRNDALNTPCEDAVPFRAHGCIVKLAFDEWATGLVRRVVRKVSRFVHHTKLQQARQREEHLVKHLVSNSCHDTAYRANKEALTRLFWPLVHCYFLDEQTCQKLYKYTLELEGLCKGEKFREWIEKQIKNKTGLDYCTFGELEKMKETRPMLKELHVFTVNPNSESNQIVHLWAGNDTVKKVIISDAIRASISIPWVFEPHYLHTVQCRDNQRIRVRLPEGPYMDGGIVKNFPIDTFDSHHYQKEFAHLWGATINRRTLGIRFKPQSMTSNLVQKMEKERKESAAFAGSLRQVVHLLIETQGVLDNEHSYNKERTIEVATEGVGTLDFQLSAEQKAKLVASGRNAILEYHRAHQTGAN